MTDRETMQRDRDRLAAQVAELDRQLAAPVLPEGWTSADTPPPAYKSVFILMEQWPTQHYADGGAGMAWHLNGRWLWPGGMSDVDYNVIAWREIPADWLRPVAAPAKYPRYFKCVGGFGNPDMKYVRIDTPTEGVCIGVGDMKLKCFRDEAWAEDAARRGAWLEITAAEAEAMVKPKGEATASLATQHLIDVLYDVTAGIDTISSERLDIRHRITAYDRLIDPATLFNIDPATASPGKAYIAKVQHGNCKPIAIPAYQEGGVWRHTCGATVSGKVIALADPDKLIGGGE